MKITCDPEADALSISLIEDPSRVRGGPLDRRHRPRLGGGRPPRRNRGARREPAGHLAGQTRNCAGADQGSLGRCPLTAGDQPAPPSLASVSLPSMTPDRIRPTCCASRTTIVRSGCACCASRGPVLLRPRHRRLADPRVDGNSLLRGGAGAPRACQRPRAPLGQPSSSGGFRGACAGPFAAASPAFRASGFAGSSISPRPKSRAPSRRPPGPEPHEVRRAYASAPRCSRG